MKIEVCINRLEDLIAVQSLKVDRVELCVEIGCGGLTPSIAFVEKALEISIIPIHVLVRPRSGHFFYTKEELDCIERDCLYFNSMGVA
ncbi:copper homeostasis protein CutC, partial [Flavobacteriaceae bacterium]|nr:copper homeostasis protein CutC [Flavobacteriaceae bacterium]